MTDHIVLNNGSPDQVMWLAVIDQAASDAAINTRPYKLRISRATSYKAVKSAENSYQNITRIKEDAENWFKGTSTDFRRVCVYAGLDPEYVRRKAKSIIHTKMRSSHKDKDGRSTSYDKIIN